MKKILLTLFFVILSPLSLVLGKEVVVGGDNVGIELNFEGILVSGTYDVKVGKSTYNPSNEDIRKGDYIIKINSHKVDSSKDLILYINTLIRFITSDFIYLKWELPAYVNLQHDYTNIIITVSKPTQLTLQIQH